MPVDQDLAVGILLRETDQHGVQSRGDGRGQRPSGVRSIDDKMSGELDVWLVDGLTQLAVDARCQDN